ncbi:MAG: type II secretion system minor pseudopilin GspH, partial [Xanthomonadaceae bacterium]|nr:type II secretion system minor pseudopilin GspH [Xanthomonadaceae bacterium]
GFTLIELLVVVVIIGVVVSAVTLSINLLGRDRETEDESRRFWALLRQAREEAELQGIDIGVFVASSAYEFLRFDPRRNIWLPIENDVLYEPRELSEGLRFRVWLESREIVLQPQLPERTFAEKDEEQEQDEARDKLDDRPPQIIVMSSGEIVPFELQIERDGAEALWRVVSLPDNDLRVERRRENREWIAVAQTLVPIDEEDDT